jgi:hypothetical protein
MYLQRVVVVAVAFALLSLSGCTPHPGSGGWLPLQPNEGNFSRLLVQFDGRAELYRENVEGAVYRCFWAGDSKHALGMRCADAANADIEVRYRLEIAGDGTAGLYQSSRLISRFRKDPGADGAAAGK